VPALPLAPDLNLNSGTHTITSGDAQIANLHVDNTSALRIEGPAQLVIGNLSIDSNSKVVIDASAGPVEIYVTGTFEQRSNSSFGPTSGDPSDLALFVAGSGDVVFDSNTSFMGTILAPQRDLRLRSNAQIYGAAAAKSLLVNSNSGIHYDENVARSRSGQPTLEVLWWRPVADIDY